VKTGERTKKLRDMTIDELERRQTEMSEEMFRLRFQWAMGQSETLNKLRQIRKDKARLLTIMREKSNG
jgi:large subunit ribosomal protein L29